MCGTLGWINPLLTDPNSTKSWVEAAVERLHRRGPDGSGIECDKGWVLGHTRLAILDLSERANQPITDRRGGWLVFNGEIYNFKELRNELSKLGYRFRSSGDTEILLYAMREWGVSCLERLRGMFAFGWLDANRRELILARDRYGVKPLAYEIGKNDFRFASDLHALRLFPGASRAIDPEAAYLYMALGYVPAPHSILKNVRKIKPGHYLRVRWSEKEILDVEEHTYWSISQIPPANGIFEKDRLAFLEEYENQTAESVRYRLISDVPVGVLLSGGIDSTLVAAITSKEAREAIPVFTMGFDDPVLDEVPFARSLAEQLGGPHQEFYTDEKAAIKILNELWKIYDEPFADSSAIPMVALCRFVAQKVKVALTGDGGDESFAGYPWHRALDRLHRWVAVPKLIRSAFNLFNGGWPSHQRYQWNALAQEDRVSRWSALRTGLNNGTSASLPVEGASRFLPLSEYFREWSKEINSVSDPIDWACRMDLLTYLPDDLMVKSDRASMSVGLELREPLLDHRLTAWCLQLPITIRYDRIHKKSKLLSREILAKRFSEDSFERPKQGFTPPLGRWLGNELQPLVIDAIHRLERGDLFPLALPGQYRHWSDCSEKLNDVYHQFLWRIVCFSEWLKHHQSLC